MNNNTIENHKKLNELDRVLAAQINDFKKTLEQPRIVDIIKKPPHYTQGIECWDYIVSHQMGYLDGNCIKYITRYRHKGKPLEDLKKARAYLDKLILIEESK